MLFFALALFLFITWRKLPARKGRRGEKIVLAGLKQLDPARYKIFNDILVPSAGSTSATQIDHLVISNFGIFCIETKAHRGRISGSAGRKYWTRTIRGRKEKIYNPLRQNTAHVKALEALIDPKLLKAPVVPFAVFPGAESLNVSGTDAAGSLDDILKKIEGHTSLLYSDPERDEIEGLILRGVIKDRRAEKLHDREVRRLKRL